MNIKFKGKLIVTSVTAFFVVAFLCFIVSVGAHDPASADNSHDISQEDNRDVVAGGHNSESGKTDDKNTGTQGTFTPTPLPIVTDEPASSLKPTSKPVVTDEPKPTSAPVNTGAPELSPEPTSAPVISDAPEPTPETTPEPDITDEPELTPTPTPEGSDGETDPDNPGGTITDIADGDGLPQGDIEVATDVPADEVLIGLFALGYNPEVVDQFIKEQKQSEFIIPKVQEFMNVRKEASATSELIGRLKVKSYGVILERGEEFTKIKSGDIVGYVSNAYLYFDEEVWKLLEEWDAYRVKVAVTRLNVRKAPKDGEVIYTADAGETFTYLPQKSVDGWYAIEYNGGIAYVFAEYCETYMTLNTAITMEQVRAEEYAAKLAKALEEAKKHKPSKVNRKSISLSDEEIYLMAALVCMEALSESYEGKLAVANVVINRMLDGYWGDTVTEVIYSPGQFTGVSTGVLDRCYELVDEDCKKAVIEALAGHNNIGDFKYFISLPKADYDVYTKFYILGNHCFYERVWWGS